MHVAPTIQEYHLNTKRHNNTLSILYSGHTSTHRGNVQSLFNQTLKPYTALTGPPVVASGGPLHTQCPSVLRRNADVCKPRWGVVGLFITQHRYTHTCVWLCVCIFVCVLYMHAHTCSFHLHPLSHQPSTGGSCGFHRTMCRITQLPLHRKHYPLQCT